MEPGRGGWFAPGGTGARLPQRAHALDVAAEGRRRVRQRRHLAREPHALALALAQRTPRLRLALLRRLRLVRTALGLRRGVRSRLIGLGEASAHFVRLTAHRTNHWAAFDTVLATSARTCAGRQSVRATSVWHRTC